MLLLKLDSRRLHSLLILGTLVINIFPAALILRSVLGPASWWNASWQYRKEIAVDSAMVDADLTDFAVLISLTDGDLASKAQDDGDDIAFTNEAGVQLSHEIEFYDGSTGYLVAWVNANLSSTVDTILYMYYGNAGASNQEDVAGVWDSSYVMVQHLEETAAPDAGYWSKHEGNPILTGARDCFGSTFYDNDTGIYHHFTSYGSVLHYTSPNGIDWVPDSAHNPVLSGNGQGVPMAWKEDGTWHMLYRYGSNLNIGLATSTDASNWTEYAGNPVLTGTPGEWDATTLDPWGVIKVDSTYYLWYNTIGGVPGLGRCIGVATSTDLITWTKDPNNPIFTGGRFCSFPFKHDGYYYMLVPHYTSGSDYSQYELYRDVNPTFYDGERVYLGVAVDIGTPGEWDDLDQDTPCVLTDTIYRDTYDVTNNELWVYYAGNGGGGWGQTGLVIEANITEAIAKVGTATAAHFDSTVNNNDGLVYGGLNMDMSGQIDGADEFDGSGYVDCGDSASLKEMATLTVEAWVKPNAVQAGALLSKWNSWTAGTGGSYILWQSGTGNVGWGVVTETASANFFDTPILQAGQWYHIVGVYNGSHIRMYINASRAGSTVAVSGTIGSTSDPCYIGRYTSIEMDGVIDEVRISNTPRGEAWISTEYRNQYDPARFYSVGPQEPEVEPPPPPPPGVWWDETWTYRKGITINHTKVICAFAADFPVLIDVTDLDLASEAQDDGDDIVFTDWNGVKLSHEIELFDYGTGHLMAWVRANLSSSTDTVLYMYYGNAGAPNQEDATGVWDSSYVMVQHLEETAAPDAGYWSKYEGNPVLTGATDAFGSTFYDNATGVYHHYCSWGTILHYNSTDGKSWTPVGTALTPTEPWEGGLVGVPFVWKEDGTWYMLYRGGSPRSIGLANSTDAVNWVKYAGNPVLTEATWAGGVQPWGVIKVESTYYLWYGDVSGADRRVGLATSTDLKAWTKDANNPIFSGGRFTPFPFNYDGYYYLLIPHYTSGTDYSEIELWRDVNPTFYDSERVYLGVAIQCGPTAWDDHDQCTPCVLTDTIYRDTFNVTNNELWTYYSGEHGGAWQTGLSIEANITEAIAKVGTTAFAHFDSTINSNNGLVYGGLNMDAVGRIDGADEFDGSDDYVDCGSANNLNIQGPFTVEAWVASSIVFGTAGDYHSIVSKNSMFDNGFGIDVYERNDAPYLEAWTRNGGYNFLRYNIAGIWTADTFYHIVATFDGSTLTLYVDGAEALAGAASNSGDTSTDSMYIGGSAGLSASDGRWPGIIDEVRVSNVSRSPCWISTEYNNQHSPSTFYTMGPEETPEAPNTPPVASDLTISPSLPYTTDNLVGSYAYFDADGDPEDGTEISWYKDDILQSELNGQDTVSSASTATGEVWYFTVRPSDGTDFGEPKTSFPVVIRTNPEAYIFTDGFEDGVPGSWDSRYQSGGALTQSSEQAHHERYSAEADVTSANGYSVVSKTLSPLLSTAHMRCYVYFTAFPTDGDQICFLRSSGDTGNWPLATIVAATVYNDGGTTKWAMVYENAGDYRAIAYTPLPQLNTWYCVEIRMLVDGASGEACLYVGGMELLAQTGLDNDAYGDIEYCVAGSTTLSLGTNGISTCYVDCVVVADTYIGTEEALPPDLTPPTYANVGTNTTLAGQPCLFHAQWTDDTELSRFIFSTNNTGEWVDEDWMPLSGASDWSNVTGILNPTPGVLVEYQFHCYDKSNNEQSTPIQHLIVGGPVEQVFSVLSNSTVSDLTFDSAAKEITFTVTGPSGTTGYLEIFLSKDLVPDITDLKVYFDGAEKSYEALSLDDLWFIYLTYDHSTHSLRIVLFSSSPTLFTEPPTELLVGTLIATIASFTLLARSRKKKTKKTLQPPPFSTLAE